MKRTVLFRMGAVSGTGIWLLLCGAFLLSLGAAFSPLTAGVPESGISGITGIIRDIFSPQVGKAVVYTLQQALCSMIIALLVGLPAAFFVARKNIPGRRLLLSCAAVPLCVPPLLVALGYVMFFGMQGVANRIASAVTGTQTPVFTFLYSFWGIVLAQGFYNFPLVMKTCADAWERLPAAEHEAAVMLGAGRFRVFRTVTLVQLLPAVASSGMVVFLYCFFSFVIVLLFGGVGTRVLEVEIYQAARSALDFRQAASLALIETITAFCVVLGYGRLERYSAESRGVSCGDGLNRTPLCSFGEYAGAVIMGGIILVFFAGPFFTIIFSAFAERSTGYLVSDALWKLPVSLENITLLFSRTSFRTAFVNTVCTAAGSAALAVVAAIWYACMVRMKDPLRRSILLRTVPLLPMAVSSVVLGFGMTLLVRRGTPLLLIIMQASLSWPFALRQISVHMDRIPLATGDAARLLSPSRLDSVFRIYIPLCRPGIISAFGFCFAVSCGDTTLPLVLALPRFETLALYTYKLAGSYRFHEACACGLVLAALTLPVCAFSVSHKKTGKSVAMTQGDACTGGNR